MAEPEFVVALWLIADVEEVILENTVKRKVRKSKK